MYTLAKPATRVSFAAVICVVIGTSCQSNLVEIPLDLGEVSLAVA